MSRDDWQEVFVITGGCVLAVFVLALLVGAWFLMERGMVR